MIVGTLHQARQIVSSKIKACVAVGFLEKDVFFLGAKPQHQNIHYCIRFENKTYPLWLFLPSTTKIHHLVQKIRKGCGWMLNEYASRRPVLLLWWFFYGGRWVAVVSQYAPWGWLSLKCFRVLWLSVDVYWFVSPASSLNSPIFSCTRKHENLRMLRPDVLQNSSIFFSLKVTLTLFETFVSTRISKVFLKRAYFNTSLACKDDTDQYCELQPKLCSNLRNWLEIIVDLACSFDLMKTIHVSQTEIIPSTAANISLFLSFLLYNWTNKIAHAFA